MLSYLAAYGATAVVILALDILWLGFVAKSFYRDGIGHLMADAPNLVVGGVFYLLYPVGVVLFAVAPAAWSAGLAAATEVPWSRAVWAGALFGFFAYATYDLSNLATLRGWPLRLTLVDIAWGTALTAAAAAAGRWALGRMACAVRGVSNREAARHRPLRDIQAPVGLRFGGRPTFPRPASRLPASPRRPPAQRALGTMSLDPARLEVCANENILTYVRWRTDRAARCAHRPRWDISMCSRAHWKYPSSLVPGNGGVGEELPSGLRRWLRWRPGRLHSPAQAPAG